MSQEKMVEIQNLYVNFYTQSGVVKAIDGVNLILYKGETFGLVGETGCGKSVTANSVMKLIPQPPGKIEKGRIFFMPPGGTEEEMQRIQEQINELRSKPDLPKDDPQIEEAGEGYGGAEGGGRHHRALERALETTRLT